MTKQLKRLTIGFVIVAAILGLPAISVLTSDDGLSADTANVVPTQEESDQVWPIGTELANGGWGNSWGG